MKIHGNTLLNILVGLLVAWLLGLALFALDVTDMGGPNPHALPKADGIVVLTGGTLRVEAGLDLLAQKRAPKLLISGVDPRAKDIVPPKHAAYRLLHCCITMGTYAEDTWGNAREAALWAAEYKMKTLIVVTSNYHMRRSLLEFRLAMPGVTFLAYPIHPDQVHLNEWWDSPGTASLLVEEYTKLLLAYLRAPLHKMFDATSQETETPPMKQSTLTPLPLGGAGGGFTSPRKISSAVFAVYPPLTPPGGRGIKGFAHA